MPFSTFCTHKGCSKQMEPYIDPKTDKVYCGLCDRELTNVTHFVKVQMKTLKQYRAKPQIPFGVKCQECNKEDKPKIVNDKIICPHCSKEHTHLTDQFKFMLKSQLKESDKDV